ncbi:MAG TPA: response regulator [Acidimicrobiales bacterium]|nr:response regulator [Acidimicrobiales bacterium]
MNKRVVIADDESIIRLDLKEILEGDGYLIVGEAARGDDALAMIKEFEPDLALLDVKMPGLDGIEVARQLKGSNTMVVLLTAFSQRSLIENARDAGVVAYLVKPFRSSELLPKLAALLSPSSSEPPAAAEVAHVVDDKIETREIVQRAKELLMEQRGLDEPAAFEVIQQSAMRGRTRMRDVAQQILKGDFVG